MSRRMRRRAAIASLCAAFGMAGCQSAAPPPVHAHISPEETYAGLVLAHADDAAPDTDVLAVTPDIEAFRQRILEGRRTAGGKLKALSDIFLPENELGLRYEPSATYPAGELFARREGNCLSFTHLFIALARASGIDSQYREIPGSQSWESIGDFVVVNRHIVAYGRLGPYADYTVDFGVLSRTEGAPEFGTVVSDETARAQHFNNLGARALTRGEVDEAFRLLRRALLIDPQLTYVWTNLGTAYGQLGRWAEAEAALREALRLDRFEVTAINQTARLYQRMGQAELAEHYRRRAESARYQNPYARYWQGVTALGKGEVERAVAHLRRAVREEPEEVHFRVQLARAYALMGRGRSAEEQITAAATLATTVDDQKLIETVLEDIARYRRVDDTLSISLDSVPTSPMN